MTRAVSAVFAGRSFGPELAGAGILPTRPVVVQTTMDAGHCEARSFVSISGETALLSSVYVKLSGIHVDYVLLSGISADGSRVVREKLTR
jgi:hypothetical protein